MMTVDDLIVQLQMYPSEAEIKVVWDSIVREIDHDNIYMSDAGLLVIDADNNLYKDEYVKDTKSST